MRMGPRFIAVLPTFTQVAQCIIGARVIVGKLDKNPRLPDPSPELPVLKGHIDKVEEAEQLVQRGNDGAVEERGAALVVLYDDLGMLRSYVQRTANTFPVSEVESVITSAGLEVRKKSSRSKPEVNVKHAPGSGGVVLEAKAPPLPAVYRWQKSTNQTDWSDLPETFRATTAVAGLTPATAYYFRLRTVTRKGTSAWSPVISIIAI